MLARYLQYINSIDVDLLQTKNRPSGRLGDRFNQYSGVGVCAFGLYSRG